MTRPICSKCGSKLIDGEKDICFICKTSEAQANNHIPSFEQGVEAAKKHGMFKHFRKFALEFDIDVDGDPEDWYDWWQCWFNGAQSSASIITALIMED